ncbi:hypothetical protein [Campylobacter lanienae]|uniref:hypothetical protein n=1 Tax=Campylobacter lanienae TaxID=75658 RepID=UPI002430B976|nr:hypothetical protein [Campylobacter lanienae]
MNEFIKLLMINQSELSKYILNYLDRINAKEYYNIKRIDKAGILVTPKGNRKYPLICAHLDTINDHKSKELPKLNIKGDYISLASDSPCECLGGDDRCGVYIALSLIKDRTPYGFGFFYDEEIGGVGSGIASPLINNLDGVTAFIGLDRKGCDELALYGYNNSELVSLFESRGYFKARGSFTDASNLSSFSDKGLACVNLSVGYYNEHTLKETINITAMNRTLAVLKSMVDELSSKPFLIENSMIYGELYQSELYYYGDDIYNYGGDDIYNYDDDDTEELEQWYIEGYNKAMEQGYEISKAELSKENLKGAEAWYISYINGFKDAIYDMKHCIDF